MKRFVAIAGNIGVGKSTLTGLLSRQLAWEPFFEAVDDNPYLSDFYQDMERWSFHSQIYFLSRRLRHHWQLLQRSNSVVQDRTVYEDAEVFARNLYRQGSMGGRDYRSYCELYDVVTTVLPPPDLIVYLRASVPTLQHRIRSRGRSYEKAISTVYLEQLNDLYDAWIEDFALCPVLTVPSDALDFVSDQGHLQLITEKVLERLQGREEVVFSTDEDGQSTQELGADPAP
ncbi:MAG: deoxynucleoside kinase [Anaerolineae bacterium]|jgi:deoxyadenosine/deoxycytidine kinase